MGSELYVYFEIESEGVESKELAELAADSGAAEVPGSGTGQVVARLAPESQVRARRGGRALARHLEAAPVRPGFGPAARRLARSLVRRSHLDASARPEPTAPRQPFASASRHRARHRRDLASSVRRCRREPSIPRTNRVGRSARPPARACLQHHLPRPPAPVERSVHPPLATLSKLSPGTPTRQLASVARSLTRARGAPSSVASHRRCSHRELTQRSSLLVSYLSRAGSALEVAP